MTAVFLDLDGTLSETDQVSADTYTLVSEN